MSEGTQMTNEETRKLGKRNLKWGVDVGSSGFTYCAAITDPSPYRYKVDCNQSLAKAVEGSIDMWGKPDIPAPHVGNDQ